MKKLIPLSIIIMIIAFNSACKKDADTTPSVNSTTYPISGTWRVSSFVKDNIDLTANFTNVTLTSDNSGAMTIHENGQSYPCNWNYNGSGHDMCHFHIMGCDDNSHLWELAEDWNITYPDSQHCNFSSHNPGHNCSMVWTKI